MSDATLLKLIECEDHRVQEWFREAAANGWGGLDEIAESAVRVHGELDGFWRCDACAGCVVDVAVFDGDGTAVMLSGDITLCEECHEAAKEAREKITIEDDEDGVREDDSVLTEDEKVLAGFLDRAESARNHQERELIHGYPRDERRQLHGYQDQIEADRFRSGKAAE